MAMPPLRAAKSGIGRLAATAVAKETSLTEVAHRSPTRLIPMPSTSVTRLVVTAETIRDPRAALEEILREDAQKAAEEVARERYE